MVIWFLVLLTRICFFYRLEERRKVKSAAYYERKKAARRQLIKAESTAKVADATKAQLAAYGY